MKLAEFKPAGSGDPAPGGGIEHVGSSATPLPGQMTLEECIQDAEGEQGVTSVTPSGIEVYYSWAPRRHYKLRESIETTTARGEHEWLEVPSVTTVLGVLDKSGPLVWWSQGVACEGIIELAKRHKLAISGGILCPPGGSAATKESLVDLLTSERLSVNHVKDSAADRGVNVHGALERWVEGEEFEPDTFPENERGYVRGLLSFLEQMTPEAAPDWQTELMVGSLQHSYAGRFDLVLTLSKPFEVVTKVYPKRKPRIEEIPAGRYLLDLKTSKRVYETHYLQLEAYEAAAVECGYAPTDYRGVVHVTADGRYELALNRDWTFEDFLSVRQCYQTMNERSIVQALRDELDAKDVA